MTRAHLDDLQPLFIIHGDVTFDEMKDFVAVTRFEGGAQEAAIRQRDVGLYSAYEAAMAVVLTPTSTSWTRKPLTSQE